MWRKLALEFFSEDMKNVTHFFYTWFKPIFLTIVHIEILGLYRQTDIKKSKSKLTKI